MTDFRKSLCCLALLTTQGSAVPPPLLGTEVSISRQAIQRLAYLTGEWSGNVPTISPLGDKGIQQISRSVKVIGDVLLIVSSLSSKPIALYIIDFDPHAGKYRVSRPGYQANQSASVPQLVYADLATGGSLTWSMPYTAGTNPNEQIQMTIRATGDRWNEIERLVGLPSRDQPILYDITLSKVGL